MTTILHLPFDELALAGSPLVPDVSNSRQVGLLNESAAIVDRQLFTGSTGFLELPAERMPTLGNTYTIQYYVTSATPNLGNVGQGQYGNGIWTGLTCSIRGNINSAARIYFWATSSSDEQIVDVPLPPANQRNHVAVVRNETSASVFINGILAGSISGLRDSSSVSSRPFFVGKWDYPLGNEIVPLYIDDLKIDDQALYSGNFTPPDPFPYTRWTVGFSSAGQVLRYSPYQDEDAATRLVRPPARLIEDMYFGGRGMVTGTVARKGSPNVPWSRRVRLIRDRDAIMVAETWSDAAGRYAFTCLDMTETYTAMSYDHTGQFESVCASGLKATAA